MNKIRSFWGRAAQFIVRRRIVFALLFAAMLVFSVFSIRWVKVENEVTAFLPEDAEARVGLEIMEEEFATYGSAKIMVKGLSLDEAERLQKEIAAQPDVLLVQFDESEQHYNGKYALYDVTFSDVVKSERSEKALAGLLDYLKDYDVILFSIKTA